ncbi:hypothetical protein BU16DRAFT_527003 [Lophium mytilinum]|uniref:Uncharacterized protein n=1 Tax=Lophium mytilinum TaxID=390894 RepID=A0A6A6QW00_9PEZI|nr:hypothetical protein BU16DRAFT_527003 [Lophium mytilinum]
MGFSSFGNQVKKRKYNHNDTFTGDSAEKESSSGANTIQLGVRHKKRSPDAPDQGEDAPNPKTTHPDFTISDAKAKARGKGKGKEEASSGLAAFLQRAKEIPDRAPPAMREYVLPTGNAVSVPSLQPNASLPAKPPTSIPEEQGSGSGGNDLHRLAKGVKNARGDTFYFLPSFIEDPWKGLEGKG